MELNLSNLSSITPDNENAMNHVKVLVIGSGPAGLAAALYAARADLSPVVLAGMAIGGQVSITYSVENYPGFPDGIGGAEMVELFQKQAERFGARVEFDTAVEVDFSKYPYFVRTYTKEYLADTIIVATGATPVHLDVPGEVEFTGKGVSYCATCDGWFFREKDVMVVGGGDSALEESLFLTRYAKSVTILHRRDQLRGGAILQKRVFENPKINIRWNTIVTEIIGQGSVASVKLKDTKTDKISILPADGVFIFIGHKPNTQLFQNKLDMDEMGYLVSDKLMQTNLPAVYAAGEVTDSVFRQVITSAGMGAAAAMQAIHFIQDQKGKNS